MLEVILCGCLHLAAQSRALVCWSPLVLAGDEPAGPWGILRFLETKAPTFGQHVNVSFFAPVINPTGFRALRRVNDWGEDPNRGFCHNQVDQPALSREGRILLEHLDDLRLLAADGFVSLHEDTEQEQFYLYTFEESDGPGLFSDMLRTVGTKYFPLVPGGMIDGSLINGGLSFRHCDSSLRRLFVSCRCAAYRLYGNSWIT